MKKKIIIEIILHLAFWIVTFLYFTTNSVLRFPAMDIKEEYFSLSLIIAVIYFNYFLLIPRFFTQEKLLKYFLFLLLILLIIATVEFLVLKDDIIQCTSDTGNEFQNRFLRWNYLGILFRDALFVGFFTMFKIYKDAIKSNKLLQANIALERLQFTTHINMIKSKINTHFFFNNLSNIYALSLDKSDKTPEIILNLTDLMEYVVADSDNEWVPLDSEIKFLKNYIALESVYHTCMNVQFDIEGDTAAYKIPPMLLEAFVNNAFKYTNINNNAYIKIKIACKSNAIYFSCENAVDERGAENVKSTGKGLVNTRNRLDLMYKNNYKLDIETTSNTFKVNLKLW